MIVSSAFRGLGLAMALFAAAPALAAEPQDAEARSVSGVVRDAAGKAIEGAEIYLADGPPVARRTAYTTGQAAPRPAVVARAKSNAAGEFSIALENETPESDWSRTWLVLWVRQPGLAVASRLVGRDLPPRAEPLEIRLAASPAQEVVVVSPEDKPLPSVRVMPEQVGDRRLPAELAESLAATSDEAGLAVLHDGVLSDLDWVRMESSEYGVQWSALPARGAEGRRQVAMAPAAKIRGRLTADDPRAIAAIPIRLTTWLAAEDDASGGGLAEVATDAQGRFEATIAAGTLSATPLLRPELPLRCRLISGRQLAAGTTTELTIPLERAVRVEGQVRDRDSGAPLAGAAVWLSARNLAQGLPTSDEEGRYGDFLLAGATSPSPWRMPRGYYFPQETLDTQAVPEGEAKFELKPLLLARGAALHGRVVNRVERGVAGAEVFARWRLPSGGSNSAHAWSDRDGAFVVEGVDPQTHIELSVSSIEGVTAAPVSVSVAADKPIELTVDPSHAPSLAGRVLDAAGKPLAGAAVRITWQKLDPFGRPEDSGTARFGDETRLSTDAEGRFQTPQLLPGLQYRAEVSASGMLPATTAYLDPSAAKTATFGDIALGRTPELRSIAGRVVDRRGQGIVGLRVFQAGDGPRRTETTTGAEGRFRLRGVYAGPAVVLVAGSNVRLQGFLVHGDAEPVELTASSDDEPAGTPRTTLAAPLGRSQRREIALRWVEPLLPRLKEGGLTPEKVRLLETLSALDPTQVSELAKSPLFAALGIGEAFDYQAARTLIFEDMDEALALGESLNTPHYRGRLDLAACDALPEESRQRKSELLAAALLQARAEPDVAQRTELIGQIAERWFDLGDEAQGTALLREGQKLAEQLPAPSEAAARAHHEAAHMRAFFAGSLARIDTAAALKLSAGFSGQFADRYRMAVALGLARRDPATAERLMDGLEFAEARSWLSLPVLHRMADVDPQRAARAARKCRTDVERGYALALVAHGLARKDAAQAAALLDEAFGLLERAALDGSAETAAWGQPAVLAAALLPVAERIDPALVDGYFWRAMALRSPRVAPSGENAAVAVAPAALAMFISRYDREIAIALVEPIAKELGGLGSAGQDWISQVAWGSLAVVDAARAGSLIDALPEPPDHSLRAAKNVARRCAAAALAPSPFGWRHAPYQLLPGVRDPDARDDARQ